MKMKPPIVDTRVRIPADVYDQIKILAQRETRSINAQMLVLFREALAARQAPLRRRDEAEAQP
jgi:hypothetical protein